MLSAWLLLLAAACGPTQAELYREGLRAETLEEALALCAKLDEAGGDCATAAVARTGQWDACSRVPDSGECHFLNADRMGLAGDVAGGLRECQNARPFADECNMHLLGLLAFQGGTVAEAEANFAAVEPVLAMKRARPQFLRLWFRNRQLKGLPLGAEACTDEVCRRAASRVAATEVPGGPPPPQN